MGPFELIGRARAWRRDVTGFLEAYAVAGLAHLDDSLAVVADPDLAATVFRLTGSSFTDQPQAQGDHALDHEAVSSARRLVVHHSRRVMTPPSDGALAERLALHAGAVGAPREPAIPLVDTCLQVAGRAMVDAFVGPSRSGEVSELLEAVARIALCGDVGADLPRWLHHRGRRRSEDAQRDLVHALVVVPGRETGPARLLDDLRDTFPDRPRSAGVATSSALIGATVNIAAGAAWELLDRREAHRATSAGGGQGVPWPALDRNPPVRLVARTATADVTIGPHLVRRGTRVLLPVSHLNRVLATDGRDGSSGPVTFGRGPGACPGAQLGRFCTTAVADALEREHWRAEPAGWSPATSSRARIHAPYGARLVRVPPDDREEEPAWPASTTP